MKMKALSTSVFLFLFFAALIAGCGSGPTEMPLPSQPPPPAGSGTTSPAGETASPSPPSEEPKENNEWESIVEAAKQEGKLILASAPGEIYRNALTTPFQEKYPEIKIEYTGSNGSDFWSRVTQERSVGQYLWDVSIIGVSSIGWDKSKEMIDPIRPLLRREILQEDNWLGGTDRLFMDKEKQFVPGFLGYADSVASVNRDFISEGELTSPEQLIDPKFKGKIVILDPRSGAGLGSLAVLLAEYGEDYVRDLLTKQEIVVTRDNRQLVEWVVRGRYPIGIGFDSTNLPNFQEQGVGLNVKELREGPIKLSRGYSATVLLKNAPHPNAAKVYLNWLLSQEGQSEVAQLLELNSLRLDVPTGSEKHYVDPAHPEQYIPHQDEHLFETRAKAQSMARELIQE